MYFSIPLEQGLRQRQPMVSALLNEYFSIPLEQGLRQQLMVNTSVSLPCILVFH